MSAVDKLIIYIAEHRADVDTLLRTGGVACFVLSDDEEMLFIDGTDDVL